MVDDLGKHRQAADPAPPSAEDAEVERLLDMGARHVSLGQPRGAARVVLADPEGNEFCVLSAGGH